MRPLRRVLGAVLTLAVYLPLHLLLDPRRAGPAAASTLEVALATRPLVLWGTVLIAAAAAVLAILLPADPPRRLLQAGGRLLARPSSFTWAVALATLALVLGLGVSLLLFHGLPTLADAMVQLLDARVLASGHLALPLPHSEAARVVQNGLVTPRGWTSVYPPGHTVLLALGLLAGAPWVVGPAMLAVTAGVSSSVFERLLPGRLATARLAGLLVATSPFLVALGGTYLSHASAAAFGAVALLAALEARDGRARWAVVAGAAMGAMVTCRPWTGLALGTALTAGVWIADLGREDRDGRWLAARLGLWMAGGAPLAVVLGAYDTLLFGAPWRLGYELAFGPAHGLGLHRDPWGNLYGLQEALGYTGFDLTMLGVHLLETPVPLVVLVGVWLFLAPRLPRGSGVLLAWALVPLAANTLYWHHGYHLGPRMLYEAAPGWLGLGALALTGLADPPGNADHRRRRVPDLFLWLALLLPASALLLQIPDRVASYRLTPAYRQASHPPTPPGAAPALVFVHGSWASRVASRLAAAGMRRDSVETALRQNPLCRVELYARARSGGDPAQPGVLPRLDLDPRPGSPPGLRVTQVSPGDLVRVDPLAPVQPVCAREMAADRQGVVALTPLLWQTALPGGEGRVLLMRDLGPEANRRLMAAFPERTAWMWMRISPEGAPALLPYDQGEAAVWGSAPEGPSGPVRGE